MYESEEPFLGNGRQTQEDDSRDGRDGRREGADCLRDTRGHGVCERIEDWGHERRTSE